MAFSRLREKSILFFLFCSGFSALVYQVSWMKLFRLLFGASTSATAAVLAVFMGGLGFGCLFFGPRVDEHDSPMGYFARLEILIAFSCLMSLFLFDIARELYLFSGGSACLGFWGATLLRLFLSVAIMGCPCFLMGGTLPAAIRVFLGGGDVSRSGVGLSYGLNTLGSVLGVLLTTFFFLEHFGIKATFYLACSLNFVVGTVAWALSMQEQGAGESPWECLSEV